MRTISSYCIFDNVSETVITTFVAVNDRVALKSYNAWIEKNSIGDEDTKLYKLADFTCPDTMDDVYELSKNCLIEEVLG